MTINQNILSILRTFFKSEKQFRTKKTTSKAATTKFFSKISNRKKISIEKFNFCEAKIPLDGIIKSINPQANQKSLI